MSQQYPPSEPEQRPAGPMYQAAPYGAEDPFGNPANPYAVQPSPYPSEYPDPRQYGPLAGQQPSPYGPPSGGYASPNAGGYGSPNPGGYAPPNAGGYGSPNAGGYASPNAGGYGSPNAGGYGSPNAGGYGSPHVLPAVPAPGMVSVGSVASQVAEYIEIPGRGVVRLASISQRFLARLLDAVILTAALAVLGTLLMVVTSLIASAEDGSGNAVAGSFVVFVFGGLAIVVITACYEAVMIGVWGATLGKLIMNVKVVKPRNGAAPGVGAAIMRVMIPAGVAFVFGFIPFIGGIIGGFGAIICYLSATFDSSGRRQGWHDKVANTVVVTSA